MVAGEQNFDFPTFGQEQLFTSDRVHCQLGANITSRSRIAIKKYIQSNNTLPSVSGPSFDSQFNKALRSGVEKGEFAQPKGTSTICSRVYPSGFYDHCFKSASASKTLYLYPTSG